MSIIFALLIGLVWIVAITCIPIMKKVQPEGYKAYAVYVLAVCVIFTIVVLAQIFL